MAFWNSQVNDLQKMVSQDNMSDATLQQLASTKDSMTDNQRDAINQELQARGLE